MANGKSFRLFLTGDDPSFLDRYFDILSREGYQVEIIQNLEEGVERGQIRDQDYVLLDLLVLEDPSGEITEIIEGRKAAFGLVLMGNLEEFVHLPWDVWAEVDGVVLEGCAEDIFLSEMENLFSIEREVEGYGKLSLIRSIYRQGKDRFLIGDFDEVSLLTLHVLKVAFDCRYASLSVQRENSGGEYGMTYQMGDALPIQNKPEAYEPGLVREGELPEGSLGGIIEERGLSSLIWSPIQGDEGPAGLIQLGKGEGSFSREDLEQLILFSGYVTRIVQYIRLRINRQEEREELFQEQEALLRDERLSCIGRLMSSVAHQINNPLQAIQINLELAQREDVSPQKREHYLNIVEGEVERLRKIVRDMIDHYRPNQRTKSLFSLSEVIDEAVNLFQSELEERGIEVSRSFCEPSPQVWGMPNQIRLVFINLISNAVDAMPQGGKIHLCTELQKGHIACMIRDSGKGIPEDQCENVFDPFFSTKENRHGLGLTICDNIITQHQGKLELLKSDEEGTCFKITLPSGG